MNLTRMLRALEITSAHDSPSHMPPGRERRLRAARSGDASGCFDKRGKTEGGILTHTMIRYLAKTAGISLGLIDARITLLDR